MATFPINTAEEFVQALGQYGAQTSCLSCGHDVWDFRGPYALSAIAERRPKISQKDIVLMAVCKRCGFVRFHAEDTLL